MSFSRWLVFFVAVVSFIPVQNAQAVRPNFLSTANGLFRLNDQLFYMYGMNYSPSYMNTSTYRVIPINGVPQNFLGDPHYTDHIPLIEAEFTDLQQLGINTISIFSPRRDNTNGYANLIDFLTRAKNHGIKVSMFVSNCDPYETIQPFDEALCLQQVRELNLAHNDALIAYEITWEYGPGDQNKRFNNIQLSQAWTDWLIERYGNLANAQIHWGMDDTSQPPDTQLLQDGAWRVKARVYYRFLRDYYSKRLGDIVEKIKKVDPNHLVSGRLGGGGGLYLSTTYQAAAKHFDYMALEQWPFLYQDFGNESEFYGNGFNLAWVKQLTGGKPVTIYEFGASTLDSECVTQIRAFDPVCYMAGSQSNQQYQALVFQRMYELGLRSDIQGILAWQYVGKRPGANSTAPDGEISDFGIRFSPTVPDGIGLGPTKSVYPIVSQYSPLFRLNRVPKVYNDTVVIDSDAHVNDDVFLRLGAQ